MHWVQIGRTGGQFLLHRLDFFFNWKIIALQYCVGLCHTSTWISHRYTYVCLENPMDRGAWQATVHRVSKSCTQWERSHTYAPSLWNLPPTSPGCQRALGLNSPRHTANPHWLTVHTRLRHVSLLLSQFVPPSPSPTASTSPFPTSASASLPWK